MDRAKPARKIRMSTCPLCEQEIFANQYTAWRLVEGAAARVHGLCLDPQVTRRAVQN